MKLLILFSLLAFSSCGTIKNLMKKGETHQKMAARLDANVYDLNTAALKEKIIASFSNEHDSPMIMLPMSFEGGTMEQQNAKRDAIKEALDDQGFSYKKSMYKNELDINWMGLLKDRSKESANIKSALKTGPYHVVEDHKDMFIIVKGITIYKGEASGADKSKLTVMELKDLKRDPMQINLAWFQILKTGQLWFSIEEGPISLEKSIVTAKRDKLTELSLLHYLDQNKFAAWEAEDSK